MKSYNVDEAVQLLLEMSGEEAEDTELVVISPDNQGDITDEENDNITDNNLHEVAGLPRLSPKK